MDFSVWIARQLPGISLSAANTVIKLAAEGSTIAFIARYRKEQTGNMDEVMIQKVIEAKEELEATLKRQAYILGEIKVAVNTKAKLAGYALVLDSAAETVNGTLSVVYNNGENDMTETILAQLNAGAPIDVTKPATAASVPPVTTVPEKP